MPDKASTTARTRRASPEESPPHAVRPSLLWFGFLGAGAAWFLHHALGYGLVEINCHSNRLAFEILSVDASLFLGLLVSGLAALVALAAALAAFRSRPPGPLRGEEVEEPGAPERQSRTRFMGYVGSLLSILFLLAILTGSAAFLFLRPC